MGAIRTHIKSDAVQSEENIGREKGNPFITVKKMDG